MTQADAELYAKAKTEYDYKKKHVYLFPHDGLSLISLIKSIPPIVYPAVLGLLVVFCALFALMFALMDGISVAVYLKWFTGWLKFFAITGGISMVYTYFLYINYIDVEGDMYVGMVISAVIGYGIMSWVQKTTGFWWLSVISVLVVLWMSLRLFKAMFFEMQNPPPKAEDYDSESVQQL